MITNRGVNCDRRSIYFWAQSHESMLRTSEGREWDNQLSELIFSGVIWLFLKCEHSLNKELTVKFLYFFGDRRAACSAATSSQSIRRSLFTALSLNELFWSPAASIVFVSLRFICCCLEFNIESSDRRPPLSRCLYWLRPQQMLRYFGIWNVKDMWCFIILIYDTSSVLRSFCFE